MKHVVHENAYRRMDDSELRAMFAERSGDRGYDAWMQAFCDRKFNSDFSKEMTRSVGVYLQDFNDDHAD